MGEWRPPIVSTIASRGEGVESLWAEVEKHRAYLDRSGELVERRRRRLLDELHEVLVRRVERQVQQLEAGEVYRELMHAVVSRQVDPYSAADELLGKLGL
jgi:LAO/AO transport system kinase